MPSDAGTLPVLERSIAGRTGTETDGLVAALIRAAPGVDRERVRIVRAPGRVNLIGEHTDYSDGLVLPAAIDREVRIAFVPTDDRVVRLFSVALADTAEVDLAAIGEPRGSWIDYVAGTAWALAEAGVDTRGIVGVVASDLPPQAGLSSSAALELASAWALVGDNEADMPIDRLALARIAQRGENRYVGVQCGLMDQFAATFGVAGSAVRLDCRSLAWEAVPLPTDLSIVVCHSGAPRTLVTSAYNDRRAECARAVVKIGRILGPDRPIRALRDIDPPLFASVVNELKIVDPVAARRADHVVHENARVDATVAALRTRNVAALGEIFAASHESLRTKFEVSSAPLDTLVDIARRTTGVVAARLTGAGFGGCTVNLVRRGAVGDLSAAVERDYKRRTGFESDVFVVDAADGAGPVNRGMVGPT